MSAQKLRNKKEELVFDAYANTTQKTPIKYTLSDVFVPRNPDFSNRTQFIEPSDFASFQTKDKHGTHADKLKAFSPNGKFTINNCGSWLSGQDIDFNKVVVKGNPDQTAINFYRALTLLYAEEEEGDGTQYYVYDPWYHIQSLADATNDINRKNELLTSL